jgi:uncharacterized protein YcgI (DUF1989 family)
MLLLKHPTLCLPAEHSLRIETGAIMAFPVRQGQLLTIVDERGGQPAALFGVDAADSRHFVSPHHTRVFSNSFILRLGMRVVTNRRRPAMVLGRDTVGAHDLLMPVTEAGDGADCEGASERFKDKVRAALARQRVDVVRVPDPINLFLDVCGRDRRISHAERRRFQREVERHVPRGDGSDRRRRGSASR